MSTCANREELLLALIHAGSDAFSVEEYLARTLPLLGELAAPATVELATGGTGTLLVTGGPVAAEPDPLLSAGIQVFESALARLTVENQHAALTARVANAQSLAHMGDYDWHIATDQNTWSDELYRIYGHEPQSFNASYERFLGCLHPDDQAMVKEVHARAYATGEPYEMLERVVRPGGEVRYLASNGEVVMGGDGQPERMRGTCIDITERVLAEQGAQRAAVRFRSMLEAFPGGVLVVDAAGQVIDGSGHATALLGGDPRGRAFVDVIPKGLTGHRNVAVRGIDDRPLNLDVSVVSLDRGREGETIVFIDDASPRLLRERQARRLAESAQRRRQALEINDNVVQGLTAASYALEQDLVPEARAFLERTIAGARDMMDRLLADEAELAPGELVRSKAADVLHVPFGATAEPVVTPRPVPRVLVVDDAEDIRALLRLRLMRAGGLEVVGEAGDGIEAIALATTLAPDLVLLDMAMPHMDGLEALPLIRAAVPGVRVIVLSGFNEETMKSRALAAGADRYVVKGGSMDALLSAIGEVVAV